MNFPPKWRGWIRSILASARSSILVNGTHSFEFQFQRGVRQGDPLSPFLFIIGMEAFSCMLNKANDLNIFRGVSLSFNGPTVSHLLYADDAILVGEWSKNNVLNLSRLLRCFHLVSGLQINYSKSNLLGIKVNLDEISAYANLIGCNLGIIPCSYLGLPIGANMNRIANWNSVLDSFDKRLSLWKAFILSVGGR
ncbi:putative mitochondrial protein AtMg01250 [Bidens hawaiensis]|uniref:putative mitochondrial protein AtMg01250 n=1 Tax=Bidens hawaiensis TaxID=980011 RepID=UPI00404A3D8D